MRRIFFIALMIVLVSGLMLSGCRAPEPTAPLAPPTAPTAPTAPPTPPPAPPVPPPEKEEVAPPPPPAAAEVIELICAHELAATSGKGRAIEEWARKVEEVTDGRVKIVIYPHSSLVRPPDQYPSLLAGAIDITHQPVHVVPELALETVYNLPMLPWTTENALRIRKELEKEFPQIAAGRSNVKTLFYVTTPPNVIDLVKREARIPDDMKGLKLCGPRSMVPFIEAIGAVAAALHPPDFYVSLEKGVIDGILASYDVLDDNKLQEVTSFHLNVPISGSHGFVVMNLDTWNSLPADIQKLIDGTLAEAEQAALRYQLEDDDRIHDELVAGPDHIVIEPTAAEMDLWYEAAIPTHQAWIAEMEAKGLPGQAAYDKLTEVIARYK